MILSTHKKHKVGDIVSGYSHIQLCPSNNASPQPLFILRESNAQEHREFWSRWAKENDKDFSSYSVSGDNFYEVSTD